MVVEESAILMIVSTRLRKGRLGECPGQRLGPGPRGEFGGFQAALRGGGGSGVQSSKSAPVHHQERGEGMGVAPARLPQCVAQQHSLIR